MAWQGEMTTIVRHLVNDVDPTNYTYSDSRLETAILVAAQIVCAEVDFETTYLVSVEQCTISPDPTDPTDALANANKDDGFINLVSLKAAVIILGSEYKTQSLNAIRVTDGPSSIDMSMIAQNLRYLYDAMVKLYDEAKFALKMGNSSVGKAIVSPFSPGSDAISRGYEGYYPNYFR